MNRVKTESLKPADMLRKHFGLLKDIMKHFYTFLLSSKSHQLLPLSEYKNKNGQEKTTIKSHGLHTFVIVK